MSLELGGHAPFIVFEDANLDFAVEQLVAGKFRCAGQTCISMNRIYVQTSVKDEFTRKLNEKVKALKVGNGLDSETNIGPLVNQSGDRKVEEQVKDAIEKGARLKVGGNSHKRDRSEELR